MPKKRNVQVFNKTQDFVSPMSRKKKKVRQIKTVQKTYFGKKARQIFDDPSGYIFIPENNFYTHKNSNSTSFTQ